MGMDTEETIRALIEAKQRQIDIELQQELEKVDGEYSANNLLSSGAYLRARGLAEIKANERKKEIEAELLLQHRKSGNKLGRWCDYDYNTRTFQIIENNGQVVSLTFRKREDNKVSSQTILFEVGYELWIEGALPVERKKLLGRCSDKVKKYELNIDANSAWLKQTRRNLSETIKNSQVKIYVKAFETTRPNYYNFLISPPLSSA